MAEKITPVSQPALAVDSARPRSKIDRATQAEPVLSRQQMVVVRAIQLALALVVVSAAVFAASRAGTQATTTVAQLEAPVTAADTEAAELAKVVAAAVAELAAAGELDMSSPPASSKDLYEPWLPADEQPLIQMLAEAGFLASQDLDQIRARDLDLFVQLCEDRVGVLVSSTEPSPIDQRMWWSDNECALDLPATMDWPIHLAVAEVPEHAS